MLTALTPAMAIDDAGLLWVNDEGPAGATYFLHTGVRIAISGPFQLAAGDPILIVRMRAGPGPQPGYEDEGVAFTLTPTGARAIAANLIAQADAAQRNPDPLAALDAEHDAAVRNIRTTAAALEQPRP